MKIDTVNWRREMKNFIGAELKDLKDEIDQLRAEVNILNESMKNLTSDISRIYGALNSFEELTRILAANSMLTNIERNFSADVESKTARAREINSIIKIIKDVILLKSV